MIDVAEAYNGGSRDFSLRAPELDAEGHVVMRERGVRVSIPKGVTDGKQIRLAGKGAPGVGGGKAGDLFLEVAIRDTPPYRVERKNVYMDLPIAPWEAALVLSLVEENAQLKQRMRALEHAWPVIIPMEGS